MDNNIFFSKIVATPTLNSWAQAYNAGKLFAVLSLEKTSEVNEESESLNVLGKNLLEKLEQEFFTIEDKNLESIKKAVSNTFENSEEGINISFTASIFANNILYLFSLGKGKVFVKRDNALGLILEGSKDQKEITSSSGFLKNNDLIILATDSFSDEVSNEDLNLALDDSLPSEITESLAPKIHKSENGKISAIVIKYGNPTIPEEMNEAPPQQDFEEQASPIRPIFGFLSQIKSRLQSRKFKLNLNKKLFLIIAIIIVGILISSVFMAIQGQNNAKVKAAFEKVYPQALKKYDEGQSLFDLNKNLARDSFIASEKILKENTDKFPPKSKEASQVQDLLKKVEGKLSQFSPIDKSGLDRSKLSVIVRNGSGTEGVAGKAANILKELGYTIASTGNADNYNYEGVTVKVKKEKSDFLELLKKDLSKDYTVSSATSDLSSDSPSDALVIIGK